MYISVFDLLTIGIGPSSSHTVGPMRAANHFVHVLSESNKLSFVSKTEVETFGSLALTGEGHGTRRAILLGLEAQDPSTILPDYLQSRFQDILRLKEINLSGTKKIPFDFEKNYLERKDIFLDPYSNAMTFRVFDKDEKILHEETYYSVGGGAVEIKSTGELIALHPVLEKKEVPYPFETAKELMDHCEKNHLTIAELCLQNELVFYTKETIYAKLLEMANIMFDGIKRGTMTEGFLPGGLTVRRRAPDLYAALKNTESENITHEDTRSFGWLNMYALAVAEENAAGGRIVTAPTNGASGVIPAVLKYYLKFYPNQGDEDIVEFLLTAAAIGILYKKGASISGAEVGCQGEIGVASSMAAAALTAVLKGSLDEVEHSAEIAMEHHLGMTCDPVMGLVQIPCIERNAMSAIKSLNASYLARVSTQGHKVSLDAVIKTMWETGKDMQSKYKETAKGGLAVNVVNC